MARWTLPALVLLAATAQGAQLLSFTSAPQVIGAGSMSAPILLSASSIDGGSYSVTVTSSSTGGQFSPNQDPMGTWSGSITFTVSGGTTTSGSFFYRDGLVGSPTLTATASVGVLSATQVETIVPLTVQDDFEGPNLFVTDSPPGVWNASSAVANTSFAISPAAAHRGDAGLRIIDNDPQSGGGFQAQINAYTAPMTGDFFGRAWVRLTASNDAGIIIVAEEGPSSGNFIGCYWDFTAGDTKFAGLDRNGVWTSDVSTYAIDVGNWHLLEWAVTGIGIADGGRGAWIDRQLLGIQLPVDFTGMTFSDMDVGEPWADDRSFTGIIDFDDVRGGVTPLADALTLAVEGTPTAGVCGAMQVGLVDVVGNLAPAPYEVAVSLASDGGAFFSASGCLPANRIDGVNVHEGGKTATAWFLPAAAGDVDLAASHLDFFGAATTVSVQPAPAGDGGAADAGGGADAGASEDGGLGLDGGLPSPLQLRVGCGAADPGLPAGWLGAIALIACIRRRRRC